MNEIKAALESRGSIEVKMAAADAFQLIVAVQTAYHACRMFGYHNNPDAIIQTARRVAQELQTALAPDESSVLAQAMQVGWEPEAA